MKLVKGGLLCAALISCLLLAPNAFAREGEEKDGCTCPCPCPERPADAVGETPQIFPKTIVLRSLMDVYETVEFTHESHSLLTESCRTCHHHSPPGGYLRCVECHPVKASSQKELSGTGLRGAYHRQCRGCHVSWENGPTGCADCHAIRKNPSSFVPPE